MCDCELVSIIVPLHNDEKNILYCISSLKKQTYKKIEIIIVENGSTDKSFQICCDLMKTDGRIKLLSTDKKGVSNARNMGIEASKGDFIFFCDSDDFIHPSMIEQMMNALKKTRCDIAVCRCLSVSTHIVEQSIKKNNVDEEIWNRNFLAERMLLDNNILGSVCNKAFSRNIIGDIRFDDNLSHCEDFYFVMQILEKNDKCKAVYIKDELYYYFTNNHSATRDRRKTIDVTGNSNYVHAFKKMSLLDFPKEIKQLIWAAVFRDSVSAVILQGKEIYRYSENVLMKDIKKYYAVYFSDYRISCYNKFKMCIKLFVLLFKLKF